MLDTKALAEATAIIVREHVASATAPLLERIAALEERQPLAGDKGADGLDGRDGKDVDPAEVAVMINEAVIRAIDNLPIPDRGEKGEPGSDGRDGSDGKDGLNGTDGKDGAGIADLVIDRDNNLVATFTDGRMKSLGIVVGKDGAKGEAGKDGRDGFSLSDFDTKAGEDGRTLTLIFDQGETRYTHEIVFPVMIYRGVFVEGRNYQIGDTVTWGGSLWHCDTETSDKPDGASKAWTLAAKRGRDGKSVEPVKVAQ